MCVTRMKNVRSVRAMYVHQKNVRATGECVYASPSHTVVVTTGVRTPVGTTPTTLKNQDNKFITP